MNKSISFIVEWNAVLDKLAMLDRLGHAQIEKLCNVSSRKLDIHSEDQIGGVKQAQGFVFVSLLGVSVCMFVVL